MQPRPLPLVPGVGPLQLLGPHPQQSLRSCDSHSYSNRLARVLLLQLQQTLLLVPTPLLRSVQPRLLPAPRLPQQLHSNSYRYRLTRFLLQLLQLQQHL
jgi:hypothetical protein